MAPRVPVGFLSAALLASALGCGAPGVRREHGPEPLVAVDFAGSYAGGPGIASLELSPAGAYEAWILLYVTAEGCATVRGNGLSRGTWAVRDGAVLFRPTHETEDLAVSLEGARARPTARGLAVTAGGREWTVERELPEVTGTARTRPRR